MSARTALLTGGGGGIGGAIAAELAADGHAVAIADLRLEAARECASRIAAAGGRAAPFEVDVTDGRAVAAAIANAERELGPIEILVNNAGWDELKPFIETDEPFWDRVIAINFKGCLHTTRELLPGMLERGYGRIVNVASDAGRVGSSMESVYAGAKAAMIAFTKTIAREAARASVTANAVCPGPTRTPLLDRMTAEGGEKLVEALIRAVPMRRLGEPEDIAAAVAFLASDRAGFITGQTLSVSGGLTMA
ncbi:MAG TPA: glucose 1-dehydrogenase [Vicinamibacterales bacterium]|nr:glucose 1-dehydrogenase [Vicinamibacterales bacterium]